MDLPYQLSPYTSVVSQTTIAKTGVGSDEVGMSDIPSNMVPAVENRSSFVVPRDVVGLDGTISITVVNCVKL